MKTEYHKALNGKPPGLRIQAKVAPRISVSALVGAPLKVSAEHLKYLSDRGVTEEVAKVAGYWTAYKPSQHPESFSPHQRRRTPTLIAPHPSPDGVSVEYQNATYAPAGTAGATPSSG